MTTGEKRPMTLIEAVDEVRHILAKVCETDPTACGFVLIGVTLPEGREETECGIAYQLPDHDGAMKECLDAVRAAIDSIPGEFAKALPPSN